MLSATALPSLYRDRHLVGWLLVAILAHALLLLLPYQREQHAGKGRPGLQVSLLAPATEPPAALVPVPEATESPAPPQTTAQTAAQAAPLPAGETEPPARPAQPSAAYLLDLVRRREWRLPQPGSSRQLGVFVPRPMPPNWQPSPAAPPTRFADAALPERTQVVDRWLAADGSHNVVITTPGGETWCGRSESWDPMNPLVEPIRVFRSCGGGGERTFDMPHPYAGSAAGSEPR
jgi:hypothetical protein